MTRNPDRKWLGEFNFMSSFNGDAKGQLHHTNDHRPELELELELTQEQTLQEDNDLLSSIFNQVSTALQSTTCSLNSKVYTETF